MKKIIIPCAVFMLFLSCNKKDAKPDPATSSTTIPHASLKNGMSSFNDWPSIENGMLAFRDEDHYNAYQDALSASINVAQNSSGESDNIDPNDILTNIEQKMGFTSLRLVTQHEFDVLNQTGWATLEEVPAVHFINDITVRSILNANADVKIGDEIKHYVNHELSVSIAADDAELLSAVHALDVSATMDDIIHLKALMGDRLFTIYSLNDVLITIQPKTTLYPFTIGIPNFTVKDPCNNPTILQVDNIMMSVVGPNGPAPHKAHFRIEWGDGTATEGDSDQDPNGAYLQGVKHTYASTGTYNIKIKGRMLSPTTGYTWDDERDFSVSVPSSCNFKMGRSLPRDVQNFHYFTEQGTDYAFGGKVWLEQYTGNGGNNKHKIGAQTWCYKKVSGNWKQFKAERAVVQYWVEVFNENCVYTGQETGASWPYSANNADANNTYSNFIGWNKIRSNHRMVVNGVSHDFDMETGVCP